MKKFVSVFLSIAVLVSCVCITTNTAFAAQSDYDGYTDAVSVILKELEIMQGDENGNMNFGNYVSRSEFTKIAVMASQWRDYVVDGEKITVFPDVKGDNWAAPFVRVGVKNGMFTGYPDGTFKPNKTVLYEEAVNVYLNMLGYDENDIGTSWPNGPVALANNIGLNNGVDVYAGKALTRYETAIITYNMLKASPKGQSGDYINKLGYTISEDTVIIATHEQDSGVGADKVYTSAGTYEIGQSITSDMVGIRGDLIIKDNKKAVCIVPSGQNKVTYTVTKVKNSGLELDGKFLDIDDNLSVYYGKQQLAYKDLYPNTADEGDKFSLIYTADGYIDYAVLEDKSKSVTADEVEFDKYAVYSVVNNDIIFYKDSKMQTVNIPDNTTIYKEDSKTTYSAIKNQLSMGDVLYIKFKDNGKVDYAEYEEGDFVGPVTAKNTDWKSALGINDNNSVSVMRNGSKTNASAITSDDILYYCKDLDLVMAYYKTVTGVYEKAIPNKDTPTSVVISGKTYAIEGIDAFNALSSNGNTFLGDTVTVLLGKDSEIAGVLEGESSTVSLYGYLTQVGTNKYENQDGKEYSSYYVSVVLPDGTQEEYASTKEYDDYINSVVKITIENGKAVVTAQAGSNVSGYVDWSGRTIGNSRIADDIKILDVRTLDENKSSSWAVVFAQRIDGIYLSSKNVCYAHTNASGEIDEMILNDVTGDSWIYGVVSALNTNYKNSKKVTVSYDVYNNDNTYTSSITGISGLASGVGIKISQGQKGVENAEVLKQVKNVSKITSTMVIGDTNHKISDKVYVYKRSGSLYEGYTYYIADIDDAVNATEDEIIGAYYDKTDSDGGRVRVIVIAQ